MFIVDGKKISRLKTYKTGFSVKFRLFQEPLDSIKKGIFSMFHGHSDHMEAFS